MAGRLGFLVAFVERPRDVETSPHKAATSAWVANSGAQPLVLRPLRRLMVPGPGPCLFSASLWHRRSRMAPLDSQPAATILQTESSRRSTTTYEKCHPRPHHRSAA